MNSLEVFNNKEFGSVRVLAENGEPLFVANDVCKALEINRSQLRRIDDDEKGVRLMHTPGGVQEITVVTESGLYNLALGSRKKEAKQFKRWITHEVIPTIRKTGGYVNDENAFINTYLGHLDERTKQLFSATLHEIRKCNEKIEADRPKVLFADAVETSRSTILVGDLAKILKQNGVDIGQKRLFAWLRDHGYLIKSGASKNMPTQTAMDRKLFEIKETTISNPDGSIRVTRTTKVTGKGQQYFIEKFLS